MVELCIVLIIISRFSTQIPVAVKKSGDYFRDLKVILISLRFVFVLGNAILIALFVISGQFSAQESNFKDDFYNKAVEKSNGIENIPREENVLQDKHGFLGETTMVYNHKDEHSAKKIKAYRRSQSEKSNHEHTRRLHRVLRRSVTENCERNVLDSAGKLAKSGSLPEDAMSDEEFRQTVEAFIARQQKFRREEEYMYMP